MESFFKDVNKALQIAWHNYQHIGNRYSGIYYNSNEDLNSLFSKFDFMGKEIFSVLSSSDQLFHLYNSGAKVVDTFDINKLTFYYYYLRKWFIEYKNAYYPIINIKTIIETVSRVSPRDEQEKRAIYFWTYFFNNSSIDDLYDFFIEKVDNKTNLINNLKIIKNKLRKNNFNFYNIDISDVFNLNKQYDYIYLSNISDYIDVYKFETFRDNLFNLLKKDGKIICSNFGYNVFRPNEFGIFSKKFNYEILDDDIGYVYKIKKERD